MLLRSLSGVTAGVCAFYAFSVLPLAQVYAILFAAPLLITVLAVPMLGETVRLRRGLAVLVGLAGVLVVLRPGSADTDPWPYRGADFGSRRRAELDRRAQDRQARSARY